MRLALSDSENLPVGILYEREGPTWEERHPVVRRGPPALQPLPTYEDLLPLLQEFS
jgi:hypothetical protein